MGLRQLLAHDLFFYFMETGFSGTLPSFSQK